MGHRLIVMTVAVVMSLASAVAWSAMREKDITVAADAGGLPHSERAREARREFDAAVKKAAAEYAQKEAAARKAYAQKLKAALDAALEQEDLDEANRIDAAAKALAAERPGAPGGPKVYLSDLEEDGDVVAHVYGKKGFGFGAKLIVGGKYSPNGIGLHGINGGVSFVRYKLPGAFRTFNASVGLNATVGRSATPLTFAVVGDGRVLWESRPIQTVEDVQDVSVDVAGVRVIELRVKCPGDYTNAHGTWREPHVVR
jgi:hypothetical protein